MNIPELVNCAKLINKLFLTFDEETNKTSIEQFCDIYDIKSMYPLVYGIYGRLSLARDVIKNLKDRFGVNHRGYFANKHDVYRQVYGISRPENGFLVRPSHYLLHIFDISSTTSSPKLGSTFSIGDDCVDNMLVRCLNEVDSDYNPALKCLTVSILSNSERYGRSSFFGNPSFHERRHIYDNFFGICNPLSEFCAYLYEGMMDDSLKIGLSVDHKYFFDYYINKQINRNHQDFSRLGKEANSFYSFPFNSVMHICEKISPQDLSILLSLEERNVSETCSFIHALENSLY
jgi:hypothetical protein